MFKSNAIDNTTSQTLRGWIFPSDSVESSTPCNAPSSLQHVPCYLERTRFDTTLSPHDSFQLLKMEVFRPHNVIVIENPSQNRLSCAVVRSNEMLEFIVQLYFHSEDKFILEFQRRSGCPIAFYTIFDSARTLFDSTNVKSTSILCSNTRQVEQQVLSVMLRLLSEVCYEKETHLRAEAVRNLTKLAEMQYDILASENVANALSFLISELSMTWNSYTFFPQGTVIALISLMVHLSANLEIFPHSEQWLSSHLFLLMQYVCFCPAIRPLEKKLALSHLLSYGDSITFDSILRVTKESNKTNDIVNSILSNQHKISSVQNSDVHILSSKSRDV